ncbi:MAG: MCE family protein [Endomicrobiaceae bacterium]|nr:MCE family protein [Endomicrobiaceae bacterium]
MSNELKLGIFVIIGLMAVLLTIMLLGNYSLTSKYVVNTYFDNTAGLPKKAKVKISGVDVGNIKDIVLEDGKAKVVLVIDRKVKLYSDATAKIVSMGIIGTKYVEINPGTPTNKLIEHGQTINSAKGASLEELIENAVKKVDEVLGNASEGLNKDFFQNLYDTVENLKKVSKTIADKEKQIGQIISNFKNLSSDLYSITQQNKQDIRDIVLELKKVSGKIDEIVTKINEGNGTIATLINDEQMADEIKDTVSDIKVTVEQLQEFVSRTKKLEIDWEYMGRFDTRNEKYRNDFGIRFRPTNHKFYYIGINNIGNYTNEDDEFERNNMNKIDALIGFRSENLEAYGGVMRSKGGVGVGWSPFDKIYGTSRRLYINAEAIFRTETAKKDDPNRDKPNIILGARLGIFNWLYVGVQAEDMLTKTNVMPYIKLKVTDEDLASIFGVAGIAAASSK